MQAPAGARMAQSSSGYPLDVAMPRCRPAAAGTQRLRQLEGIGNRKGPCAQHAVSETDALMRIRIPSRAFGNRSPADVLQSTHVLAHTLGVGVCIGPRGPDGRDTGAGAALDHGHDAVDSVGALVHAPDRNERPSTCEQITNHNSRYEFGTGKTDVSAPGLSLPLRGRLVHGHPFNM